MKTIHLIISGRVQGVYFRAFTKKQAIKNNVAGFVSNKENGNVEVVAQAEQENLELFIDGCNKGPIMAKVDRVIINDYSSSKTFSQFEIR